MKTSSLKPLILLFVSLASSLSQVKTATAQICTDCTLAVVDWTTLPSTYTHRDGQRVAQYDVAVEPTAYAVEQRQTSVYRYHRSSLQGNNSVDHYHRVDRSGGEVQPYGEWRYPYRPFSVPYGAWGPQLPQALVNANITGMGYGPNWSYGGRGLPVAPGVAPNAVGGVGVAPGAVGVPGQFVPGLVAPGLVAPGLVAPGQPLLNNPWMQQPFNPGFGNGLIPGPNNALPPQLDEYYPDAPEIPQLNDRDFFYSPIRP